MESFLSLNAEVLEKKAPLLHGKNMLFIGVPKESKLLNEYRVALTPDAVGVLVHNGVHVAVERGAGEQAFYSDHEYAEAGAKLCSKEEVFQSNIIFKTAPIHRSELDLIQDGQFIFSPLQLFSLEAEVIDTLLHRRVCGIAYEWFQTEKAHFPILRIMSELAGTASMLIAAQYLTKSSRGQGVLLGGITGVPPAKVIVIGAGIVGEFATRTALALGAEVKIFDNSFSRLKRLQNNIGMRLYTSTIQAHILARELSSCEVAIGAFSSTGKRTPLIVSDEMVQQMQHGSVIIDVSMDGGGCFESSQSTTIEEPTFIKHGVVHYCVPNIPSNYARTASNAFSNILLPFIVEMQNSMGFEQMLIHNPYLRTAIYMFKGKLTNADIGKMFEIKSSDLASLLTPLS